jgi:hypothetical protein
MDPDLIQAIQQEALRKAESKHIHEGKSKMVNGVDSEQKVDDETLPPGWKCTIDKDTKKPYYYNKQTKQTSWVRPT